MYEPEIINRTEKLNENIWYHSTFADTGIDE